ncbi:MAG TPA: ImmA/IrrE family metallo-endopeptidase [Candidatus Acidoferrales bacterium]|nr:ImmA/IrrE family metallo-endopeptidase [Candidatus Acidoferrales bacterium]
MMLEPKIIKTDEQYQTYLAEVGRLAAYDPMPGTLDGDRLELLAKLVEDYEKERYRFERPDPIEAIRFRMEEQGLRQKDLAPLLGGRNRVSEILARKRPLTLSAVRALSDTLHISADLLVRGFEPTYGGDDDIEDVSLPLLAKSGWFSDEEISRFTTASIVQRYLKPRYGPLYLRQTLTFGSTPKTNKTNLKLWVARVRELADKAKSERGTWRSDTLNEQFLVYVAQLSWTESGPRLAKEVLAEKGITLVILPALPQTKLDGAAMRGEDDAPVIGITLRHDRLDNFWFTLLHELVHAWKHIPETQIAITDEDVQDERDDDAKEAEANNLAKEAFIPRNVWKRSDAFLRPSVENIITLSDELHISPAIIAGRLRREKVGYSLLNKLVGYRQVRKWFPHVKWN